jgi:hypothetical protein
MVSHIELTCLPKLGQQKIRAPGATQVDILGRSGSREAQFEDDASLQDDCIPEDREDSREESVEDELLAYSVERPTACPGCILQTVFKSLFERGGRLVLTDAHRSWFTLGVR